jgi:hypothetical protein
MLTNNLLGSRLTLRDDTPVVKEIYPVIPDPEALGLYIRIQESKAVQLLDRINHLN